ncbi:MAG: hypothetical protein ACP5HM_02095 [Anaerolineae bacterium]
MTSCAPFVDTDQPHAPEGVVLPPNHTLGQTFVARHGGLNGVEFWLKPTPDTTGVLTLSLRTEPGADKNLVTTTLALDAISTGFQRFTFEPLRHSHGRYYYAFITFEGEGEIQMGAGPGDAYIDGALYRDHEPQDAQAAFRLTYDPWWMALELAGAAVRGVGLMAVALLIYAVPGWALLAWFWPHSDLTWAERLALAVGMSLALYPLLLLWTDVVGLHLGALYAWIPVVGSLVALAWRYRDWRPRHGWDALKCWVRSDALWPDVTLLIVLALTFGVRLLVVRTLDAPMWGDSYHHTMIAQLLVDNKGLFDSWEPYADLRSFTYHFGFHTAVAVFHWVTRTPMVNSVIWVGQLLNGLAVFTPALLTRRISKNPWAVPLTVLLSGLLSPMPMYYANWGRYTQLAGQVILPVAVWLSWEAFNAERRRWRSVALTWLAVGGLALTHYRVLIFYVVFVLAWWLVSFRRDGRRAVSRVATVGLGGALLFLPWFMHIAGGKILANFGHQLTTPADQISGFARQYNAIGDLTLYLSPAGWLLLAVALGGELWRRKRGALVIGIWWLFLLIATNPAWLRLPGSGAISNFALFIAMYLPWGILVGVWVAQEVSHLTHSRVGTILVVLVVVVIGLVGFQARMGDLRVAQHAMVTRPDLRAMAWIREHVPRDAKFLVNSFFAYGDSVIVGSDGGWWLPVLAARENTVPPLNYGTEDGAEPGYRLWINEVTAQIQESGVADPATLALLEKHGVTHVYVGQQGGRVNYQGPHVLSWKVLEENPHFRLVYHQDRVWVFEIKR